MIVVFGSVNLDLVTRVARFPAPGETVAGTSFHMVVGGKGANQSLAAARAGAQVRLYGALGCDALAAMAIETLSSGGVDVDGLGRRDAPSGCAIVQVDDRGENCIVVVPGANAFADPDSVPEALLCAGSTLLLQHEVPARFAAAGSAAVASLAVVVTLGAAGAIAASDGEQFAVPAPCVDVFDTTGAGDAFVGTLAAALDGGSTLALAVRRAVAAGSHACTEQGARKPRASSMGRT